MLLFLSTHEEISNKRRIGKKKIALTDIKLLFKYGSIKIKTKIIHYSLLIVILFQIAFNYKLCKKKYIC